MSKHLQHRDRGLHSQEQKTPTLSPKPQSPFPTKSTSEDTPFAPTPEAESPISYRSLPLSPDLGPLFVDDLLGQKLGDAYFLSRLEYGWREQKYGKEVASTTKRRWTPSPVRRAYAERQEDIGRIDDLPTDSENDSRVRDDDDLSEESGDEVQGKSNMGCDQVVSVGQGTAARRSKRSRDEGNDTDGKDSGSYEEGSCERRFILSSP
ncbi:hypothetical protein AJ80_03377 [Polytolypa hystricis UAMH7299]|uniref:Uncharacterized protein n=1 Tax=Polytolypa hystricis (strain UAMH7299) TaxID=1447883 RepID=A0A2B7YIE8_POLH7|nr:hypothetical protein AJ80_03377 [Polytolypa hystricis UAMH7299]